MNAIITGAAGGFGRAAANECARLGYDLFLTDLNLRGLSCIKEGIERRFGVNVKVKQCDLTDPDDVDSMLRYIDKQSLRFDMLLNIAGLDHEGTFLSRSCEQLVEIIALNDIAAVRMTHSILQRRKDKNLFTIIFMSSLASMFPMPVKATYAASKRFLCDFSTALRYELKEENVNILTVYPGGMQTTPEAVEAILAQGIWGDLTTSRLEKAASESIRRALAGKTSYIPGICNKSLAFLGKLLPPSLTAAIVFQRWQTAGRKRMDYPQHLSN
jgi:uncharacterized protein